MKPSVIGTFVLFFISVQFHDGSGESVEEKAGMDDEQIQREEADADIFDIFNQPHQYYPQEFKLDDLGRRHQERDHDFEDIPPGFAPPEFVLSIARKSEAINEYNKRHHPENFDIPKEHLRTGQYWNSFWVEKVDPEQQRQKALRSSKLTKQKKGRAPASEQAPGLESVKAKIHPGSELYKVVSKLTESSPKLLYVINEGNK